MAQHQMDWSRKKKRIRCTEYEGLLIDQQSDMESMVSMSNVMAQLISRRVIDDREKQNIEEERPNYKQVGKLVDHLKTGDIQRFYHFLLALNKTNQHAVVRLLGFDPDTLSEEPEDQPEPEPEPAVEPTAEIQDEEAKKITEIGVQISNCIKRELVYLKGSDGLVIGGTVMDYVVAWELFSDNDRVAIKECNKDSEKLTTTLDALARRPAVEVVLFTKIFLKQDVAQSHHFAEIFKRRCTTLTVSMVKELNEDKCREMKNAPY